MKKWIASTALASMMALAPIQAYAELGDTTLKPGMTHTDVKSLQSTLKQKGYFTYTGSYTTYYGSYTTDAVKKLQRAKGLIADGVAGPKTFSALGVFGSINETSLISYAKTFQGVPYLWGGTSPSGFDCSGFMYYVFKNSQGITLPRTASQMYTLGTKVSTLAPGDLVFFSTYAPGASHVGIYIGGGNFISATSSKGVAIVPMSNTYWSARYLGAKRL
ncbi:C40 family peptidase [Fictibacillus aquaticus]|uniref:Endopeptidase n=1 Tax=Fictibacillus aquaticus TaxID=2021314 RepID=A0A235FD44_9BACL|nr:NlpC/P60 family protein [Fictibacillus aquaticus]OYD59248.1 endopeptidase [Fictibacillus aquaticus]